MSLPDFLSLDYSVTRDIQVVRRLTSEFFRMCAVVLDLRRAGKRTHHTCSIGRLEAQVRKETGRVLGEQIQMTRATRVRGLARPRIDSSTYRERSSAASIFDSTPITPTASSPTYATM